MSMSPVQKKKMSKVAMSEEWLTQDGEESCDNGDDKEAVKKLELVAVLVRQAWPQWDHLICSYLSKFVDIL